MSNRNLIKSRRQERNAVYRANTTQRRNSSTYITLTYRSISNNHIWNIHYYSTVFKLQYCISCTVKSCRQRQRAGTMFLLSNDASKHLYWTVWISWLHWIRGNQLFILSVKHLLQTYLLLSWPFMHQFKSPINFNPQYLDQILRYFLLDSLKLRKFTNYLPVGINPPDTENFKFLTIKMVSERERYYLQVDDTNYACPSLKQVWRSIQNNASEKWVHKPTVSVQKCYRGTLFDFLDTDAQTGSPWNDVILSNQFPDPMAFINWTSISAKMFISRIACQIPQIYNR